MPLYRRLPKFGFKSPNRKEYDVVNVADLNKFSDGEEVTVERLREEGLIKNVRDGVKILGDGDLDVSLTVRAHKFSRTAQEKIEKAGGKAEVV